jgi:hypothetical protein
VNTESATGAATIGGKTSKAKTSRVNNQLVFTAGNFTVTLAGVNQDGSIIPLSAEGILEVRRGDMFRLDAQGFAPGSTVDIWMFSKTIYLGKIEVGTGGLVKSTFKVPKSVDDGLHHVFLAFCTAFENRLKSLSVQHVGYVKWTSFFKVVHRMVNQVMYNRCLNVYRKSKF